MRIGPVTFLFVTVGGWAAMRTGMLWPEPETPAEAKRIVWHAPLRIGVAMPAPSIPIDAAPPAGADVAMRAPRPTHPAMLTNEPDGEVAPQAVAARPPPPQPATTIHPPQPAGVVPSTFRKRFSVSSWMILRGSGSGGLAAAGQLGGSQAGIRARYDLGSGLALAARVSGPLREQRGKEAAVALDWRPVAALPVTFTIERRAGLDRGGRDAFAAGVFGGVDSVRLPFGARLDGYAQAGVVGVQRHDFYVDGAVRIERPLIGARIGIGAGVWGGAQPGVSRLDAGPQLVGHLPIGPATIRIGAEWRQRIVGNARPGSGPALAIGADF